MGNQTLNWNTRCLNSIREEKAEIAKRYNIRFGQTEIYCGRCKVSISNPTKHICADLQLQNFYEAQREKKEKLNQEKQEISDHFLCRIRSIGRTKVATMLEISPNTVNRWIDRGKIPKQYHNRLSTL
jgi:transposase-like protein